MKKIQVIVTLILLTGVGRFLISPLRAEMEKPLLEQFGEELLKGFLQADFRETPLNEIIILDRFPLPEFTLPDQKQHPCLLFRQNQIAEIQNRSYRDPYGEWAGQIIQQANLQTYDPISPLTCEYERSVTAKTNAFAYVLTRAEHHLETTLSALTAMTPVLSPSGAEGGTPGIGWGDWMEASQAIGNYALAYDLIYTELHHNQRLKIEQILSEKTDQIYRNFSRIPASFGKNDLAMGLGIPKNNHIVIAAVGVATAALVLDDNRAQTWFDKAMRELQSGLAMINPDGSYREGAYYARFIASHLFILAGYLNQVFSYNLWDHPGIIRFTRWLIDLTRPDGSVPLFDDAFPDKFIWLPLGIGLSPWSEEMRYWWEQNSSSISTGNSALINAYCLFDDRISPCQPQYPQGIFYPDGGTSIFRDESGLYGFLLSEPGRPFLSGHDHAEPGAFTISFGQNQQLIDPGYGSDGVADPNRDWFVSPGSHNIPLVNGFGPDQNPVWGDELGGKLVNSYSRSGFSAATVMSEYRETIFKRTIWFPGEYFIVSDRFNSDTENRITIPWNGMGQISRISNNQTIWKGAEADLECLVLKSDNRDFDLKVTRGLNTRSFSDNLHERLEIQLSPATEGEIISLFLPQTHGEDRKQTVKAEVLGDGNISAYRIWTTGKDHEDIILAASEKWEYRTLSSDAATALFRFAETDRIEWISLQDASYLEIENEKIFYSDHKFDIYLNFTGFNWQGYFLADDYIEQDHGKVAFVLDRDPGIIRIDGRSIDYETEADTHSFALPHSGNIQFGVDINEIPAYSEVKPFYPVLLRLSTLQNPAAEMQTLDQFDRIRLGNEITAYLSRELVIRTDSLTGGRRLIPRLYGLLSGIYTNLWNAEEGYVFKLQHRFDFSRRIGQHKLRYLQESVIHRSGLLLRQQRLWLDEHLYLSHTHDFADHNLVITEFNSAKISIAADLERFKRKTKINSGVTFYRERGYLTYRQNWDQIRQYRHVEVNAGDDIWRGSFNWIDENDSNPEQYQIGIGRRTGKLSTGINSVGTENGDLRKLEFSANWRINSNFLKILEIVYKRNDDGKFDEKSVRDQLIWKLGCFNGYLSFITGEQQDNQISATIKSRLGLWKLYFNGNYHDNFRSDFKIIRRGESVYPEVHLNDRGLMELHISMIPDRGYRFSGRAGADYRLGVVTGWGAAISIFRGYALSLHLQRNHSAEKSSTNLGGSAGINIGRNEMINFVADLYYNEIGNLQAYEFRIDQTGGYTSPGILIARDHRGLYRAEGYLQWKFY